MDYLAATFPRPQGTSTAQRRAPAAAGVVLQLPLLVHLVMQSCFGWGITQRTQQQLPAQEQGEHEQGEQEQGEQEQGDLVRRLSSSSSSSSRQELGTWNSEKNACGAGACWLVVAMSTFRFLSSCISLLAEKST